MCGFPKNEASIPPVIRAVLPFNNIEVTSLSVDIVSGHGSAHFKPDIVNV
jgi:hypothetical protein